MKAHRTYRLFFIMLSLCLFLASVLPTGAGSLSIASAAAAPESPVNPDASPEAVKLLSYLYSISGNRIITGQHDYLESPDEFNNKLQVTSSRYAALHGYELGAINGQTDGAVTWLRQNVVSSAIKWHKAGGIVAMTYHANLPGTTYSWANVQKSLSQADFDKYVTPGTTEYNNLITELDKVAVSLKTLRDAGVPVLWRPYHEMNGDWFWWGKKKNFADLWDIMYDRFVNVHKLNNLLWVWSPNAPNSWADPYIKTYPGADKVDILAADIYNKDFNQYYYDSLLTLAAGKPIAIGENGQMPDPAMLPKSQSKWVFMMTWGKMLYENNSTTTIKSFLNNGFTLTRDEIITAMAAFTAPAPSPTPTPTPSPTPTPTPSPTPTPTPSPTPDPVYQPIGQDSAMQDNPAEPAAVEPLPVPSATPEPPQARNGLLGEYFTNIQLTGTPVLTREESAIDFNWGTGAPDPSVGTDRFSVRWSGKIKALYSENYSFYTSSDDGIRLWVNGTAVITSWATQYGLERKGRIDLEAGKLYDIKIEYYDNTGSAKARLMWESPSQIKEVVPSGALYLPGSL